MRKYLFFVSLLFLFTACSKDDDNTVENKLQYINVKVTSDDISEPSGNVYLFYLSNYKNIQGDKYGDPYINSWAYDVSIPFFEYKESNGENKDIYPVSKFGNSYDGKLIQSGKGYSSHTISWYELSSLQSGTPLSGGRYGICVCLRNGTYGIAYKEFTISKNSIITVHLSTCKNYPLYVTSQWDLS